MSADRRSPSVPGAADSRPRVIRRLVLGVAILDGLMGLWIAITFPFWQRYTAQYGGTIADLLHLVGLAVQVGLGALIVIRRPRHPVGWLLLASATFFLLDQGPVSSFVIYAIDIRHRTIPGGDLVGSFASMLWVASVVPIAILMPLVFPTGRLLSPRWRPVVWVTVAMTVVVIIAGGLSPNPDPTSYIPGVRPVSLPEPFSSIARTLTAAIILLPVCLSAGIAALVLRYRRGSSDERHQIRWILLAGVVAGAAGCASLISGLLGHTIPVLQALDVLGLSLVPAAAAIAVLRYRLYDIDVVISRTLVYGSLAAFITAVYVGVVVGVGTLVGSRGQLNLPLSIAATTIVAVVFQPLQEALQRVANRLVYGRRATPYEVLSQFSASLADTDAVAETLPKMARLLAEGTGSEDAQVWLKTDNGLRAAAGWPAVAETDEPIPLDGDELPKVPGQQGAAVRYHGELLGALTVTRRPGESLSPIEQKLLDDLARQAGLVLKNAGLTAELLDRLAELRASRQRLVSAQDEERRRLERNLHDGAQQNLVAMKVKLGLAESLFDRDPARAQEFMAQLRSDADDALETLRDLARGIYPPLLADKGLPAAVMAQARKVTVPVTTEFEGVGRYPQEVEAAIYFCVLEALQNVEKYAGSEQVNVRVHDDGKHLHFEVKDDGRGFDPGTVKRGAGLTNMADRMDALGGGLTLESEPGDGARLSGFLPLGAPVLA